MEVLVVVVVVVDKMNCECDIETANFKSNLYCNKCGMDIRLNPLKFHNKSKTEKYCCEGCAR